METAVRNLGLYLRVSVKAKERKENSKYSFTTPRTRPWSLNAAGPQRLLSFVLESKHFTAAAPTPMPYYTSNVEARWRLKHFALLTLSWWLISTLLPFSWLALYQASIKRMYTTELAVYRLKRTRFGEVPQYEIEFTSIACERQPSFQFLNKLPSTFTFPSWKVFCNFYAYLYAWKNHEVTYKRRRIYP